MRSIQQKEIKEKVWQITRAKRQYDNKFQQLQHFIHTKCKSSQGSFTKQFNASPIHEVRKQFAERIQIIRSLIQSNKDSLNLLKYKSSKIQSDSNTNQRIESLEEYFNELGKKVNNQFKKGEQMISARERWQLIGNKPLNSSQLQQDQSQALLNGVNDIKQTNQNARNVYQMLSSQGNKISQARQKMGSVLKNINFAGNILQMIKTRSKQDNKLILMLSIGLVIEIILCLFVIKPWFRGQ